MLTTSLTLLDRLRQANQPDAWDRFVRLYAPMLVLWAKRQGLQDADAADLVQDVLLKLISVLPSYERREGSSFRGWLFRVTTNQCRDFQRRQVTRALPTSDGLSGVASDSPLSELEEVEYRQLLIRRGLGLVRPDFTEATWAAFAGLMLDDRPVTELAAELGITENAVYLARHRVLTRLRQELDGFLD